MAKRITPAIVKIEKRKRLLGEDKAISTTPLKEAWRRFKRNKVAIAGGIIFIVLLIVMCLPAFLAPEGFDNQDYSKALQEPSAKHWFGTDKLGRDILSRLIWGARVSLPIGLISVAINLVIGGLLGAIAAFFGGWTDMFLMRALDIIQAIPPTLMAIAICASLGGGMVNLILALTISGIAPYAKVTRAAVLTVRANDYIEAASAIGASTLRQIIKHMIPNALGPIIVTTTFSVASTILVVASLSYIGLGLAPPTPEWGSMLAGGREYLRYRPHILLFPGFVIMLTVLSLNMFGDGLRDALDPRLK